MLYVHNHNITATSILDLRMGAPEWVDARAATCETTLNMFDPISGFFQFYTQSAYSRNTWVQMILFDDWENLVVHQREQPGESLVRRLDQEKKPWGEYPGPELQARRRRAQQKPKQPWGEYSGPEQEAPYEPEQGLDVPAPEESMVHRLEQEDLPWGPYSETNEREVKTNDSWPRVYSAYPELINADVKISCSCPAFRYWGSQYLLEQRNTTISPEGVPYPHQRQPKALANLICKHLAAVFDQHF
jgi:hypothetical protein